MQNKQLSLFILVFSFLIFANPSYYNQILMILYSTYIHLCDTVYPAVLNHFTNFLTLIDRMIMVQRRI